MIQSMLKTDSERAPILLVIGFVFFIAGAGLVAQGIYFQIPMAIGSAAFFVLALFYVIREEKPITSLE